MNTDDIQRSLSESRYRLRYNYELLADELNVTMRVRQSIRRKPWTWIGGALATGVVASFFRKTRSVSKKTIQPPLPPSTSKGSSVVGYLSSLSSLFLGETSLALAGVQLLRFLIPVVRPLISEYLNRKIGSKQS